MNVYAMLGNETINDFDYLGLIPGAENFYNHWLSKKGTTLTEPFSDFGDGWKVDDFKGFEALIKKLQLSGNNQKVNLTLTHQTGFKRAGRVTLRLKGTLSCLPPSGWKFDGKITIDSEIYNFDWKKKGRTKQGKVATFLGGAAPGVDYVIHFFRV